MNPEDPIHDPAHLLGAGKFIVNPPVRPPLWVLCQKQYAKDQPGASLDRDEIRHLDRQYAFVLIEFFDTKEAAQEKAGPRDTLCRIERAGDTIQIRIPK